MPQGKAKTQPLQIATVHPVIIGIGVSDSSGMSHLGKLLSAIADKLEAAFVIAVASDIGPLKLDETIQSDRLKIIRASETVIPHANSIYHVAENRIAEVTNGGLRSASTSSESERHSMIDSFFASLAKTHTTGAVGVLLGSRGTDGILGLRAICEEGGITVLERPVVESASALRESLGGGEIDYVAGIEEIPAILHKCLTFRQQQIDFDDETGIRRDVIEGISVITEILREQTNHNFRDYKTSTLVRRIERRMKILRLASVSAYISTLRGSGEERSALFRDLLISVTSFFRDESAFESLTRHVLPSLFTDGRSDPVRIWVPGCATGQEAYSLAILCDEFCQDMKRPPEVQILATDIDTRALAVARRGIYPSGIATQMSQERLDRYFVKKAGRFHVAKEIREKCLFSIHNLISDPPFSKLDLISCRNMLIYLGMHLQVKLIPLFHFAMRTDGFLLLGPSESLSGNRELFTEVDLKNRLWQRTKSAIDPPSLSSSQLSRGHAVSLPVSPQQSEADLQDLGQRIILGEFAPEWAIINEEAQILTTSQGIEQFLQISGGTFRNNVIHLTRSGLKTGLRVAFNDSIRSHRRIDHGDMSLPVAGGRQRIRITVQPMPTMGAESALYMVVFHKDGIVPMNEDATTSEDAGSGGAAFLELQRELSSTREDLEKSVQEVEAANEELKSFNEELLSMNEELQTSNEELEASRAEVTAANRSLIQAREDLESLLISTEIAMIFLDRDGVVRNFTDTARQIYHLIDSDIGRPLRHLTHRMSDMPPIPSVEDVENGIVPDAVVVRDDHRSFSRQVRPHKTREGRIAGIVLTFPDITQLRAVEARTRMAFDAGQMGMWYWFQDRQRFFLDARMSGFLEIAISRDEYSVDEALGMVVPEHRERLMRRLVMMIDTQSVKSYREDVCVLLPQGHVRWIAFVGAIDRSDAKVMSHRISGAAFDFSDRMEIETRLREREQFARTVIENSPDCFKVMDSRGSLLMMNRRGCELMELDDVNVIVGQQWCSLWPVDVRDQVAEAVEIAKSGGSAQFRAECPTAKGTPKYWDVIVVGVPDATGGVSQIISVSRDITEQRLVEMRVSETAERLQSAIEVAGLGTITVDYQAESATLDSHAAQILGLQTQITMTRSEFHDLFVQEDRDRLNQLAAEALASGSIDGFSFEAKLQSSNGLRVINIRKRNSFAEDGTPLRGLLAIQDITERKNYEMSLQTARILAEAATKSRGEFLANMSHEIRTPMTAILGHADILAENTTDPDNLQCVDTIRRNGRFLLEIINDILDLSRIDAGQLSLRQEPVALDRLLADVRSLMDVRAAEKNLRLTFEFSDRIPARIETDSVRLRQVLLNLIGNAIKFTHSGHVNVRTSFCAESGQLSFAIEDTGIGISECNLRKLFVPFQQADDSTTRVYGGTGLGLAISRRLAHALRGDISVFSEPGKGSIFTLTMKCGPHRPEQLVMPDLRLLQPQAAPAMSIQISAHVLIVDDRRDIRSLAQHFVEKAGGTVTCATNGQEAVQFLLTHSPASDSIDIVLLDMQMPVMDGYEAARRLRDAGFNKPIIALTANAMTDDRNRCLEAGCTDYTTKPLDAANLIALIASLSTSGRA